MAVALECINFIVPFSVIRKKYPGGLVQCLLDHRGLIEGSGPIWFDEHLFRDGAMNDLDIMLILSRWEAWGQAHSETPGEEGLEGLLYSVVGRVIHAV